VLPQGIRDLLQQVQSGRFVVHLEHKGLEPSVNRLVFGMLTSALFIGSAWMWGQGVAALGGVPIVGPIGCTISMVLGVRLLWAIRKSGRLDEK
jgi:ubiquinone biosynthesis protein